MSNVYYKFASELNFNHVNFDGLHISVVDLKKAILHQKRLGKATDFDLLISNAETKEEYKDENGLIPKNTSLIITRIPINNQHKKTWEVAQAAAEAPRSFAPDVNHDISKMNGSEEDKIKVMMMQSTLDYDPTNYQRVRGNQTGDVPPNYRCYKCQKPGHWIKNCPMNPPGKEYSYKQRPESKKMTGIPRSLRDNIGHEPQEPQFIEEKREIPEELICTICKGIFRDAVMVPCCGSSFCDDCVRTALLESEDNECPDCKEKETSPGSLIPNRFLRKSVADFLAESSNAMARESLKKEEPVSQQEEEKEEEDVNDDNDAESCEYPDEQIIDQPHHLGELDEISPEKHEKPSESEEEEDDDNIVVTVPPPHQQSRGATFRDARIRRIPSHGMDSQSVRSSQDDETESFGENNSDSYSNRGADSGSKRSNTNDRYEIPTLGGDKNGSHNIYPIHSSSSLNSHNDYPPQQQQQQQQSNQNYQNPNQSSGMMPQMHPQSMYTQNHYQGNYYQPNQMRPMGGYDQHQGNYQQHPIRHHHHHQMHHQMMRPMNDNFGVRHPRPPMNNLANAVSHDIQQRFGSGYIDDPLEAFNRIMREKEMRKERFRRSPQRHSPEFRRKNFIKIRKRSRSNGTKSLSRSKSRSRSPRYRSRKDRRHNSRERRDDRRDYRSPQRRGLNSGSANRKSRSKSKYKTENLRHGTSAKNSLERQAQADKIDHGHDRVDRPADYGVNHNLDEQPPPPGDETVQPILTTLEKAELEQNLLPKVCDNEPESSNENSVDEKKSGKTEKSSKSESSHHHKKSRRHDSPENSEKREKKKRKKSKEHEKEKKKSKKDKREKKHSKSPSEKELKSEKTAEESHIDADASTTNENQLGDPNATFEKGGSDDAHENSVRDHESREKESSNSIIRSDSILDINIDEKMDEFFPQESKWDREDDKCSEKNESFDIKTNANEEKITHEIIKRAENAIFAKAIREIRPTNETKKKEDQSSDDARSTETTVKKLKKSPLRASIKSRLGVKVSDDSPKTPRSKTPESRRKLPISSCIKVNTQDSRANRSRRSRSVDKKKPSRSPRRSRSRDVRGVGSGGVGQRGDYQRKVSPRRTSRSRDLKPRRRTPSKSRETRDDRTRKPRDQPSGSHNRQRKHSPEPSKKQEEVKQVKSTRERESSRSKMDDKKVSSISVTDEDSKKERSSRIDEDSSNLAPPSKRTRTSSSSSSSSSNSDDGSENKRHKNKAKKKSRSPSAEHSSSKRKKSKKEKKAKKKKKSKK